MKSKKTISVSFLKDWINDQLAHPNNTVEEKMGFIATIETVLLKADAYKGYMYLELEPGYVAPALGTDGWASRKYF